MKIQKCVIISHYFSPFSTPFGKGNWTWSIPRPLSGLETQDRRHRRAAVSLPGNIRGSWEDSGSQIENYHSQESVSINLFLHSHCGTVCGFVHLDVNCVSKVGPEGGSLIPIISGSVFTPRPWLIRSWKEKWWKGRRQKAAQQVLGLCGLVFIVSKNEIQVFVSFHSLPSP